MNVFVRKKTMRTTCIRWDAFYPTIIDQKVELVLRLAKFDANFHVGEVH